MTLHELQVWLMASGKAAVTNAWQISRLHRAKKHPELKSLTKQFEPKFNEESERDARISSAYSYFHALASQNKVKASEKPA